MIILGFYDPEKLAILTTEYSLPVSEEKRIGIWGSTVATSLIQQLCKQILLKGGHPEIYTSVEGLEKYSLLIQLLSNLLMFLLS